MHEIRLFGMTSVMRGDSRAPLDLGGVKPRQILEILTLANGVPVSKERLADLLWEGAPPRSYLATLESYVCVLRRQLGSRGRSSILTTTAKGYVLDPNRVRVDLVRCRSLLEEAGAASDGLRVAHLVQEALTVSHSPLLASEPYVAWAERERDLLTHQLVDGCVSASESALALGEGSLAVQLARRGVELDSYAEEAWRQLMRALATCGRRAEALQAFSGLREAMVDQLGVEPAGSTMDLYLEILRERSDPASTTERHDTELRALLALLRCALESTPGVTVPKGDSGLSFAAVQALTVV